MSSEAQIIADCISDALKKAQKPVALHEPELSSNAWLYVKDCIDTGWVSTAGAYVEKFSQELSHYTGLYAVPVVNGTAALHMCLLLAGVQHDEEVFVPTLTFVATANAVSYLGARPHFIDCQKEYFSLDLQKLEDYLSKNFKKIERGALNKVTGKLVRALIVTHVFGHIDQIEELRALCQNYNIQLIEDAAEALGSFYKGRHAGHFGYLSALSFNGNKIITTGGGGAILTADKTLADQALHLTTTAKVFDPYMSMHDQAAYNYRMPNINAALGCAQMEDINSMLQKKRKLSQHYKMVLNNLKGVQFINEPKDCQSNFWLNAILLESEKMRNTLIDKLGEREIYTRGIWYPMHQLPMYKESPRMDCSHAEHLTVRGMNLPSSAFLEESFYL